MRTRFGNRVNALGPPDEQDRHAIDVHAPQLIFRQLGFGQDRNEILRRGLVGGMVDADFFLVYQMSA